MAGKAIAKWPTIAKMAGNIVNCPLKDDSYRGSREH
jgi:hypothetical protein